MPHSHEMKQGQVYYCEGCGLELKVVKECKDCGTDAKECACGECSFVCCDKPMQLK
jgi:hypothetical protein